MMMTTAAQKRRMKRTRKSSRYQKTVRRWGRVWIYMTADQKDMVEFASRLERLSMSAWISNVLRERVGVESQRIPRVVARPASVLRRRREPGNKLPEHITVYLSREEQDDLVRLSEWSSLSRSTLAANYVLDAADEAVRRYNQAVSRAQSEVTEDLRSQIRAGRIPKWLLDELKSTKH